MPHTITGWTEGDLALLLVVVGWACGYFRWTRHLAPDHDQDD